MLIGYDTVSASFDVPADAEFAVCYSDARYRNVDGARARFPALAAQRRIIALTALGNPADGEDIEPGNVGPAGAAAFVRMMHATRPRPVLYADQSDMHAVVANLAAGGIPTGAAGPGRPWRMFTAHPTGAEHLCGPATCGFPWDADLTQFWWSSIQGRWRGFPGDLDVSAAREDAFESQPIPTPPGGTVNISVARNQDGRLEAFAINDSGQVFHTWQTAPNGTWEGAVAGQRSAAWYKLGDAVPVK